jgi:hypothetical protein
MLVHSGRSPVRTGAGAGAEAHVDLGARYLQSLLATARELRATA